MPAYGYKSCIQAKGTAWAAGKRARPDVLESGSLCFDGTIHVVRCVSASGSDASLSCKRANTASTSASVRSFLASLPIECAKLRARVDRRPSRCPRRQGTGGGRGGRAPRVPGPSASRPAGEPSCPVSGGRTCGCRSCARHRSVRDGSRAWPCLRRCRHQCASCLEPITSIESRRHGFQRPLTLAGFPATSDSGTDRRLARPRKLHVACSVFYETSCRPPRLLLKRPLLWSARTLTASRRD